ncbi:antibiotic biosynthesis monooxygenase [Alteromonas sp. CI.11.F.A3]|uniref:putative quinol monooxygenase n=1 Tax=Alteromonas sp. CI.11.F.A3 TaxID=3079555 RepID=UPI002942C696|nr:antibiotic biosynthesis monooxygenase [Alteromonas sp. CI.11.F.A3]WOI35820.1 antibiotic biosynthesis monooxygenase [Alteromonas sp. CI.11.F.A3]
MKVTLKGFIDVPESELTLIKRELEVHTKLTQEEKGCITFSVVQDENIPTRYEVYEEFNSQEDFDFHQSRVQNSNWGKVSKNVKRNYQITNG